MLKLVEYILAIQALINVGTINDIVPKNTFDKTIYFITYTFSYLYIFIEVNNFLNSNESNIVRIFFIKNSDYLLLKVLVTIMSNVMELYKGNEGLIRVLSNLALCVLYDNKTTYFNITFSNVIFREIVIPIIRIIYNNIFLGKDINLLISEKDKLVNGIYYLTAIYFLSVVIMLQNHKLFY